MPDLDDSRFDKIENFLGGEYQFGKEIVKLKGRLFDVPFIYSTITDSINSICLDTNIEKDNVSTKEMSITFNVMCHKSNLKLDNDIKTKYRKLGYTGNRLDIIVAILGDILNRTDKIKNIGQLIPKVYNPVASYFPNSDFFGKVMSYTCSDFMMDYSSRSLNG